MWQNTSSYCRKLNFVHWRTSKPQLKSIISGWQVIRGLTTDQDSTFPKDKQVVICGGGIMGAAVAYHLAALGLGPNTVILESKRIGEGTTWQSSGLVGAFKPSFPQVKLAQDSIALYKELEKKGLPTGWKQCGSLCLARTRDRMTVFRRMKAQAVSRNIECHLVTPSEIQDLCSLLQVEDLIGGIWIPGDGVTDPYQTCLTLINEAQKQGVQVFEKCQITKVINTEGCVSRVETTLGSITCEHFVNCAGFWARNVGKLSNPQVKVPLHPVEHYYLHTKKFPNLDPMTPVIRDLDGYIYLRENNGCLLAGGFEPSAKPAYEDGTIPG